jgi:hypothetical protein
MEKPPGLVHNDTSATQVGDKTTEAMTAAVNDQPVRTGTVPRQTPPTADHNHSTDPSHRCVGKNLKLLIKQTTMKLCSGILNQESDKAGNKKNDFYNSLMLTDDISFQRKSFTKTPICIPHIYITDAINDDDNGEPPMQTRTNIENKMLLKIAILIATNASTIEITQSIIDSGTSCCVTPHLKDFVQQPIPIQNTTLKGIAGGLTALGK